MAGCLVLHTHLNDLCKQALPPLVFSTDEEIVQPREDRSVWRVRPFARRAAPFALAFEPFAIVDRSSRKRRRQRRSDRGGRWYRWTTHTHLEGSGDQRRALGIHGPSIGNRLAPPCSIRHNRFLPGRPRGRRI